ncbi:MAG: hypothetical protein J7L89_04270 [Bacteroidales bacterium]|nr:hypothetical protein [Bacteroidales bacterium]
MKLINSFKIRKEVMPLALIASIIILNVLPSHQYLFSQPESILDLSAFNVNEAPGTDCWDTVTRGGSTVVRACHVWYLGTKYECKIITDASSFDLLSTCDPTPSEKERKK